MSLLPKERDQAVCNSFLKLVHLHSVYSVVNIWLRMHLFCGIHACVRASNVDVCSCVCVCSLHISPACMYIVQAYAPDNSILRQGDTY